MGPMKIRAITLDLDDTLWPVAETIRGAEKALQAWLSQHAPRTAANFNRETMARWRPRIIAAHPDRKTDLSFLRREIIRHVLREQDDDPALADPAFEVFLEARQQVRLFDDALPALQRLAARVPIVALSNGNADIARIGIDQYFVGRISSATLPVVKPHPDVFTHAVRLAGQNLKGGLALAETLHVGDDVAMDVLGARRVGMQTAWIHREGQSWEEAEQHQASLRQQFGLHQQVALKAQPDERPHFSADNLITLVDQLEQEQWF